MNTYHKPQSGLSLIEIVLGILILSTVIITFISMFSFLYSRQEHNSQDIKANLLAQEAMEISYNLSVNDWNTIQALTPGTPYNIDSTSWSVNTTPTIIDNLYTRTLTTQNICRDPTNDYTIITCASGIADPNTILATIQVTWNPAGIQTTKTVTYNNYLINPTAATQILEHLGETGINGPTKRVTEDLIALYTFSSANGDTFDTVHDIANPADPEPLHLTIEDPAKVSWLGAQGLPAPQGLRINDPTVRIYSNSTGTPASDKKIINIVAQNEPGQPPSTDEFTAEVWYRPLFRGQTGISGGGSIISLSRYYPAVPANAIDFLLGHEMGGIIGRIRSRGDSGEPTFPYSPDATWVSYTMQNKNDLLDPNKLHHIAMTREPYIHGAKSRIYLDGNIVSEGYVPEQLDVWNIPLSFKLTIGNTYQGAPQSAIGDFYLASVYKRALTDWEIKQNFIAGPGNEEKFPTIDTSLTFTNPCSGITTNLNPTWGPNGFTNWENINFPGTNPAGLVQTLSGNSVRLCGSGQTGTFNVTNSDQGQYFSRHFTDNNIELTARVDSFTPFQNTLNNRPSPHSQFGIVLRANTNPNSPYNRMTYDGYNMRQYRKREISNGKPYGWHYGTNMTPPFWIKIVRSGQHIVTYSTNPGATEPPGPIAPGSPWQPLNLAGLNVEKDPQIPANNYYLGFYVTSEQNGQYAQVQLSNISILTGAAAFNPCAFYTCGNGGGGGGVNTGNEPVPPGPPGGLPNPD